ncbi:MAG: hypothetical protein DHS20C18_55710 [Saprospiraceae bacterium]|nr:MAG: hypothetical protein DHS20C18_55710 [Saprospiraceae bacterium]
MTLVKKSNQNYQAFLYLKEGHFYTPSVHCCYYSCFQLVLAFLQEFYPDDYEKFNLDDRASHKHQINTFLYHYFDKFKKENGTKLKRAIFALKVARKDADYEPSELLEAEKVIILKSHVEQFRKTFKQDISQFFD